MSNELVVGSILAFIIAVIGFWIGFKKGRKKEGIGKFSRLDIALALISLFLFLFVILTIFI